MKLNFRTFILGIILILGLENAISPSIYARIVRGSYTLNEIALKVIDLKARLNQINMRSYLGEDVTEERKALNEEARKLFLNEDYYRFISEGFENAPNEFEKRRFKFLKLYFDFMRMSISPEIEKLQNEIMQKRKELIEYKKEVLPEPEEPTPEYYEELDKLWKDFGKQVEPLMRELVKLRNQRARELGYEGWRNLKFKLSEIDEEEFERLFQELKSKIIDAVLVVVERAKREIGWDKIYSAHQLPEFKLIKSYTDRTPEGEILSSTFKTLESIGIDIPMGGESPIEIIYSEDLPFVAYNFLMKPGKDGKSIIILNLKYFLGPYPDTPFHEIGHAIYDYSIQDTLPPELQRWEGIYSAYSEAMAEILSLFMKDIEWLKEFFFIKESVDGEEVIRPLNEEEAGELSRALKIRMVVADMPYWMGNYEFEKEIYENPDQDFEELFTEIKKEYRREDYPIRFSWVQMIPFFASADESMYYQNYILRYIIAAQVHTALREKFGTVFGKKEIGKFLIERLYQFGMSRPWREVIREATGKDLDAGAFIDEFIRNLIP